MGDRCLEGLLEYIYCRLREIENSREVLCKICGEKATLFDVVDFGKCCHENLYPEGLVGVPVYYRICESCQFIFTDFFDQFSNDQWRAYIYNEHYSRVDPEYLSARPQRNALEIESLLIGKRRCTVAVDFGGGNGRTAELLRQRGWNYVTIDPFGHSDATPDVIGSFNFCSAFEVFEHSPDPLQSLREIIKISSPGRLMILIGTGINDPNVTAQNRLSWWYAAPRNGHISLFSRRSLQVLAQRCGLLYASVSPGTHLLFRGMDANEVKWLLLRGKALKRFLTAMRKIRI